MKDEYIQSSINLMMEEHRYIKRMLQVVRNMALEILNGDKIIFEDFEKVIDFIRNYADDHHHGKEEKFLFQKMEHHLGRLGEKLVRNGMYVEHDLGRLYIKDLEEALKRVQDGDERSKIDIIGNAVAYTNLLERHIAKEDEVIYPFAERNLDQQILKQVDQDSAMFEKEATTKGIQEKYMGMLKSLECKYNK